MQTLRHDMERAVEDLVQGTQELRAELSALDARSRDEDADFTQRLEEQRSVEGQGERTKEVAAVEQLVQTLRSDTERALEDVVQRTLTAVTAPLEEVRNRQVALEEQLTETGTELRALEQLRAEMASLAQAVEHTHLLAAQEALEAVADPLRDLTRGREGAERRLDALSASVDAGASRHHRLEQRLSEVAAQLDRLVESRAEADGAAPRRHPGHILEALDRQLRAAEERLAQR